MLSRYLLHTLLRAAAPLAVGLSALLIAVDALDPAAASEPHAALLFRAPSLVAVALVVTAILSPAVAVRALGQSGALRALEAAGGEPGRKLAPMALVTAVACALGALGAQAIPVRAVGSRPMPLAVQAYGAPRSGHWRAHAGSAVFEAGAVKREVPPPPLWAVALLGGALVAWELWRARTPSPRRVWALCATTLLLAVAVSVVAVNYTAGRRTLSPRASQRA